ncbi:ATP-binding cassette sub-family F member 2 [Blattella germanica]|nr:ATP-binding cassette sub-family F member 2 [Blattella germanica]
MPSDAKKKQQQKKKEAAKARQAGRKAPGTTNNANNKAENGSAEKDQSPGPEMNGSGENGIDISTEEALCRKLEADAKLNAEARACTGSLAVHPRSRDVKIDNLSISFHGHELLQDTTLELNCGRRYGLLGLNGSGKSTLLSVLGNREVPIPEHIDIFHLTREMPASDKTALQCVMEVDEERVRLEKLAEELVACEDDESQEQLMDVYERLDDISADTAEARAAWILHGLGFTKEMQAKKTKDFSGN